MQMMDRCSDVIIAVSDAAKQQAIGEGTPPEKIVTIRNSVPFLETSDRKSKPLQTPTVFGCVARLFPDKGQRYLIEAIPRVLSCLPASRFVFVGGGPEQSKLEARAVDLGVSSSVQFLGDRTDVAALLDGFDVLVLPSLAEGFPNAALEAMAVGIPVVATSVGGTPEVVIDAETGLLVPPESPIALADALVQMATDSNLRETCVKRAFDLISSQFAPRRETQETVAVYESLLRNAQGGSSSGVH
jgi:glycosyltransferase involved in cell wall biosynthesis